jgi:hypothetical protein
MPSNLRDFAPTYYPSVDRPQTHFLVNGWIELSPNLLYRPLVTAVQSDFRQHVGNDAAGGWLQLPADLAAGFPQRRFRQWPLGSGARLRCRRALRRHRLGWCSCWLILSLGYRLLITVTMRHTGSDVAQHPFSLQITCPDVISPTLEVDCGSAVPAIECIGIVLPHLFFGSETVGELLEH